MARTFAHARRANTLVEVTVSTALVAVVVVASLETLGGAARSHQMAMTETDAVNLAEDMIAEVTARDYADPQGGIGSGLEGGEANGVMRDAYDDVDDYQSIDESPPVSRSGMAITGYAGWTRKTRVRLLNRIRESDGTIATRSDDQGLKRISVEVIDPAGMSRSFVALRSAHGPGELHPAVNTGVVRGVEVSIEAGGGARVTAAAASANESRAP
jgi:MSHA pilin protein MshD